ncbi:MAG: flagellar assembly protein T N-terminal domain-containing protein [Deltaproteobacteria bacterium]|nr:flagellar assembly protein T N-terminal domain-containing protein [Deltaproteobacteria bacterium]
MTIEKIKLVFLKLVPALFVLIAVSSPAHSAEDELKTVEASGVSIISGGNVATARDAALADALRKAVEQAVGTLISSETMVENYQVLNDNVYTKSQGYVKEHKVTSEGQEQNMYRVSVRAVVSPVDIKNDLDVLGILQMRVEKPRVLFMIAEQSIGEKKFTFWWDKHVAAGEVTAMLAAENSLKEIFINKGFHVVDVSGSEDKITVSNAFRVADLTAEGARQIGRKLNAEIVVKGRAIAKEGPRTPGSPVAAYNADITADVVRVDDGVVLASSSGHGAARHISDVTGSSDAIKHASEDVADKLITQIIAKWSKGNTVTIRLTGVTDYKRLTEFKNLLRGQVRGVSKVYQRRVEGTEATIEIETKVTAQGIADDISRLPGAPVKVISATQNTVEAVMSPSGNSGL